MKTTIELNLTEAKHRKALRKLLDVLDEGEPGLNIGSATFSEPPEVQVYTSIDGAPYVDDVMTTNDIVEKVETVNSKTGDTIEKTAFLKHAEAKLKEAGEKAEAYKEEKAKKPDARKLVEAVVNVKTETTEASGTIEEVVETLTENDMKAIKALQVKVVKLGAMEEARQAVRGIVGGPLKLSEIPAKHAKSVAGALKAIVERVENAGS
jgi:hypothetical protein